jgi:succinate-acetate transporter protein
VLFALAAGFGLGAFLLSLQWVEVRTVGAASHLVATALAAGGAIWIGVSELPASPNSVGYWSPWMAFALAAALIAMGYAVLGSLFVPIRHKTGR